MRRRIADEHMMMMSSDRAQTGTFLHNAQCHEKHQVQAPEKPQQVEVTPWSASGVAKARDEGEAARAPLPLVLDQMETQSGPHSSKDEPAVSDVYEVEKITGMRLIGSKLWFHVRWKGYSRDMDTWEPRENLNHCEELLDDYISKVREKDYKQTKRKRARRALLQASPPKQPKQSPPATPPKASPTKATPTKATPPKAPKESPSPGRITTSGQIMKKKRIKKFISKPGNRYYTRPAQSKWEINRGQIQMVPVKAESPIRTVIDSKSEVQDNGGGNVVIVVPKKKRGRPRKVPITGQHEVKGQFAPEKNLRQEVAYQWPVNTGEGRSCITSGGIFNRHERQKKQKERDANGGLSNNELQKKGTEKDASTAAPRKRGRPRKVINGGVSKSCHLQPESQIKLKKVVICALRSLKALLEFQKEINRTQGNETNINGTDDEELNMEHRVVRTVEIQNKFVLRITKRSFDRILNKEDKRRTKDEETGKEEENRQRKKFCLENDTGEDADDEMDLDTLPEEHDANDYDDGGGVDSGGGYVSDRSGSDYSSDGGKEEDAKLFKMPSIQAFHDNGSPTPEEVVDTAKRPEELIAGEKDVEEGGDQVGEDDEKEPSNIPLGDDICQGDSIRTEEKMDWEERTINHEVDGGSRNGEDGQSRLEVYEQVRQDEWSRKDNDQSRDDDDLSRKVDEHSREDNGRCREEKRKENVEEETNKMDIDFAEEHLGKIEAGDEGEVNGTCETAEQEFEEEQEEKIHVGEEVKENEREDGQEVKEYDEVKEREEEEPEKNGEDMKEKESEEEQKEKKGDEMKETEKEEEQKEKNGEEMKETEEEQKEKIGEMKENGMELKEHEEKECDELKEKEVEDEQKDNGEEEKEREMEEEQKEKNGDQMKETEEEQKEKNGDVMKEMEEEQKEKNGEEKEKEMEVKEHEEKECDELKEMEEGEQLGNNGFDKDHTFESRIQGTSEKTNEGEVDETEMMQFEHEQTANGEAGEVEKTAGESDTMPAEIEQSAELKADITNEVQAMTDVKLAEPEEVPSEKEQSAEMKVCETDKMQSKSEQTALAHDGNNGEFQSQSEEMADATFVENNERQLVNKEITEVKGDESVEMLIANEQTADVRDCKTDDLKSQGEEKAEAKVKTNEMQPEDEGTTDKKADENMEMQVEREGMADVTGDKTDDLQSQSEEEAIGEVGETNEMQSDGEKTPEVKSDATTEAQLDSEHTAEDTDSKIGELQPESKDEAEREVRTNEVQSECEKLAEGKDETNKKQSEQGQTMEADERKEEDATAQPFGDANNPPGGSEAQEAEAMEVEELEEGEIRSSADEGMESKDTMLAAKDKVPAEGQADVCSARSACSNDMCTRGYKDRNAQEEETNVSNISVRLEGSAERNVLDQNKQGGMHYASETIMCHREEEAHGIDSGVCRERSTADEERYSGEEEMEVDNAVAEITKHSVTDSDVGQVEQRSCASVFVTKHNTCTTHQKTDENRSTFINQTVSSGANAAIRGTPSAASTLGNRRETPDRPSTEESEIVSILNGELHKILEPATYNTDHLAGGDSVKVSEHCMLGEKASSVSSKNDSNCKAKQGGLGGAVHITKCDHLSKARSEVTQKREKRKEEPKAVSTMMQQTVGSSPRTWTESAKLDKNKGRASSVTVGDSHGLAERRKTRGQVVNRGGGVMDGLSRTVASKEAEKRARRSDQARKFKEQVRSSQSIQKSSTAPVDRTQSENSLHRQVQEVVRNGVQMADLPQLKRYLETDDDPCCLATVCAALTKFMDSTDAKINLVVQKGFCPVLVRLLRNPSVEVVSNALMAVSHIVSGSNYHTQAILECVPMSLFRQFLDRTKFQVSIRKETCLALSNITAGTSQQIQHLVNAGLFPVLMDTMRHDEFQVMYEATWAVANATVNGSAQQIRYVVEQGFFLSFCDVLKRPDDVLIQIVLDAISNVLDLGKKNPTLVQGRWGGQVSYCESLKEYGGLHQVKHALTHGPVIIKKKAHNILSAFFSDDYKGS